MPVHWMIIAVLLALTMILQLQYFMQMLELDQKRKRGALKKVCMNEWRMDNDDTFTSHDRFMTQCDIA